MERIDNEVPRANPARVIVGLVLITLAAFLFADNFDLIPRDWHRYIFSWQMLLIVIGLISLAKSESRTTGIVLISVGAFFLAARVLQFPYSVRHFFWPSVFAVIGILLLVNRSTFFSSGFSKREGTQSEDFIDDVSIFGGSEQRVNSKNFRGGKMTNIFGGSSFDMLDAGLAPGRNTLDIFYLFGGSKLLVPPDWKVRVEVAAIFGGFSDKRKSVKAADDTNTSELVIKGVVIFGGGELKNL